jgi:DDE superfamily endonuclease
MENIVGIVDGTHVAIVKPWKYPEEDYINRKGYHSLNVQVVCDHKLRITNINAKFPGRSHDSHVWRNSKVFTLMKANHNNGDIDSYIIGLFPHLYALYISWTELKKNQEISAPPKTGVIGE